MHAWIDLRFYGNTGSRTAAADNSKNQLRSSSSMWKAPPWSMSIAQSGIVILGVADTAAYSRPADLEALVKLEIGSAAPPWTAKPLSRFIIAVRCIGEPRVGNDPGRRAMVSLPTARPSIRHSSDLLNSDLEASACQSSRGSNSRLKGSWRQILPP